jgi:hypothetical protein
MIRGRPDGRKPRAQTLLVKAGGACGYESLFRSDHLTGLFGESKRASLDTWASRR